MASQLDYYNDEILKNLIIQCNMLEKDIEKAEKRQEILLEILQSVLSCDKKRVKEKGSSLINVFQLDNEDEENHSVEFAILRAFLNSHKKEYYENLKLALQWNRVDIAKMDIFSPEFVELFLEFVDLESFLTVGQLEEFYNHQSIKDSDKHNPLFKLYPFENNKTEITSAGLKSFFKEHFFDDFDFLPDFLPDFTKGRNDPVKFAAKNL